MISKASVATSQGRADRPNEDAAFLGSDFAIVLDGAGGPSELDNGCMHGVVWFVRELGARLVAEVAEPARDLKAALRNALVHVADLHRHTCDLSHPGSPSCTVAMMRVGEAEVEHLVLSDCTVLIEHGGVVDRHTDQRIAAIAPEARAAMARYPTGSYDHQRYRVESVRAQQAARNQLGGFWVAAAQSEAADHAYVGSLPRSSVSRAALLTDGAARAGAWGLLAWDESLDLMTGLGPEALIDVVRQAEDDDPEGAKWPRTKHADDATAVLVTF